MSVFAKMLSDPDKRNVAAYFATQVPKPGVAHDKDTLDDGQRIYRAGVPERAIPACAGCHGPAGDGLPVIYPRIGGQHAEYIVAELKAWRDGTRRNSIPMVAIAARLRESEASAVADYIDGLHREP
jgi:cytochrome c553